MQWCRLYAEIIDDPKTATLHDSAFRLFIECLCLAARAEKEGDTGCNPKTLAFMLRRKVSKPLDDLMSSKLVYLGPEGTIIVSAWGNRQFKSDNVTQRSKDHREKQRCNGDATLHETLQATTNATTKERCVQQECNALEKNREEKNREEPPKSPKGDSPPDGLDLEAWERWRRYRTDTNRAIKPASVLAAQRKLAKFGRDQAAVVEEAIANGWQGFFALKDNGKPSGSGGVVAIKRYADFPENRERADAKH